MDVIRNFIKISGLADKEDISCKTSSQVIQYSESEIIFISKDHPSIHSIFQIIINLQIKDFRRIHTPVGTSLVLDGSKKLKILYTDNFGNSNANILEVQVPYNTFVESADNIDENNISVYVTDAYFELLDEDRIYCSMLYLIIVPNGKQNK